jgi:hypothetical protein
MSFVGQSIRNNFPLWSKIRRDDSSVGAIIFDNLGQILEEARFDLFKKDYQANSFSLNPVCEPENMFVFSLSESNEFNLYQDLNRAYEFLIATGIKDNIEYELENLFSYSELALALPTRITLKDYSNKSYSLVTIEKNEDSSVQHRFVENTFYLNDEPRRLYINIFDSTNYEISTYDENLYDKRYITIRGTDLFGKRIEETININRDGFYKTSNIFRTIEKLEEDILMNISGGEAIECYGFDGEVEILRFPLQVENKKYEQLLLVKKVDEINSGSSLEENIAEFRLSGTNTLQYIFNVYRNAEEYLNKRNEPLKEYFEQVLLEQNLLDANEEEIEIQDFAFDYARNRLLCIDSLGVLHWYKLERNMFSRPIIERTKKSNITFESEKQQVVLGETLPMFVSLERAKGNVEKVLIAKQKPSFQNRIVIDENDEVVNNFNFEYLQEDLSWSEERYFFSGRDVDDIYLNFEGKTIESTFNEYGQHDFYIFSFANQFNKENSLSNFINGDIEETEFKKHLFSFIRNEFQEIVLIDTYSVFCEYNTSLKDLETGILTKLEDNNENPEEFSLGVFYEGHANDIFIIASNEETTYTYKVEEFKDYILYNYDLGEGATIQEYDSIKINLNGAFEEEVFYNG